MKLKEFFYLIGFKPKARKFGYEIIDFDFGLSQTIKYARWLHPADRNKKIEKAECDELTKFIKPGDAAIDIGAHSGDSSIPMAIAAGPDGTVFSFEPNPYVFPILEKNANLNTELTNIVPLNYAATQHYGEFECQYGDSGYCNGGIHEGISKWKHGSAFKVNVKGVNVTDWIINNYPDRFPAIQFIKIDTEGHDLIVLKSLIKIIKSNKPYIKTEVNKHTPDTHRKEMFHLLNENGYSIHLVLSDDRLQGQLLNENDIRIKNHFDIFCIPSKQRQHKLRGKELPLTLE